MRRPLAVLYFYQRAVQERTPFAGAALGLALSLLFFDKVNYWLLMMLAMAALTLVQRPFEAAGAKSSATATACRKKSMPSRIAGRGKLANRPATLPNIT